MAEGTLNAVVPAQFTVSVAPAWGGPSVGEVWVIQFTSVPAGMLATSVSIDIYQPNGIQLLAPTPTSMVTAGFTYYLTDLNGIILAHGTIEQGIP